MSKKRSRIAGVLLAGLLSAALVPVQVASAAFAAESVYFNGTITYNVWFSSGAAKSMTGARTQGINWGQYVNARISGYATSTAMFDAITTLPGSRTAVALCSWTRHESIAPGTVASTTCKTLQ